MPRAAGAVPASTCPRAARVQLARQPRRALPRVCPRLDPDLPRRRRANQRCRPSSLRREDGNHRPRLRTAPSNFGNCSQLAGPRRAGAFPGTALGCAAGRPAPHPPPRLRGARRRRRHRARGARSEPRVCGVSCSEGIAAPPRGTLPDRSRGAAAARRTACPLPGSVTSRARRAARASEGRAGGGRGAAGATVRTGRRAAENDSAGRSGRRRGRQCA